MQTRPVMERPAQTYDSDTQEAKTQVSAKTRDFSTQIEQQYNLDWLQIDNKEKDMILHYLQKDEKKIAEQILQLEKEKAELIVQNSALRSQVNQQYATKYNKH